MGLIAPSEELIMSNWQEWLEDLKAGDPAFVSPTQGCPYPVNSGSGSQVCQRTGGRSQQASCLAGGVA